MPENIQLLKQPEKIDKMSYRHITWPLLILIPKNSVKNLVIGEIKQVLFGLSFFITATSFIKYPVVSLVRL